jgi:hypothetical protein
MNPPLRARGQLALFAGVYLLYLLGRWVTGGDMAAGILAALGGFAARPALQRLASPRLVPVPA